MDETLTVDLEVMVNESFIYSLQNPRSEPWTSNALFSYSAGDTVNVF